MTDVEDGFVTRDAVPLKKARSFLEPMDIFLSSNSAEVIVAKYEFVPLSDFMLAFKFFCWMFSLEFHPLNDDDSSDHHHYEAIFNKQQIHISTQSNVKWRGKTYTNEKFLVGVGLRDLDEFI